MSWIRCILLSIVLPLGGAAAADELPALKLAAAADQPIPLNPRVYRHLAFRFYCEATAPPRYQFAYWCGSPLVQAGVIAHTINAAAGASVQSYLDGSHCLELRWFKIDMQFLFRRFCKFDKAGLYFEYPHTLSLTQIALPDAGTTCWRIKEKDWAIAVSAQEMSGEPCDMTSQLLFGGSGKAAPPLRLQNTVLALGRRGYNKKTRWSALDYKVAEHQGRFVRLTMSCRGTPSRTPPAEFQAVLHLLMKTGRLTAEDRGGLTSIADTEQEKGFLASLGGISVAPLPPQ